MVDLLGIPYSPWSEKARWALEARSVPYHGVVYPPLLGEPRLRWKLRRWSGAVSVPVLTDDEGRVIADSAAIARWADERGEGPVLFPKEQGRAIDDWVALSERGLAAGRGLSLARVLEDRDALAEMVPKALRGPLGAVGTAIAAAGVRRTLRKYGVAGREREALEGELTKVLDELRAALDGTPHAPSAGGESAPKTLLGTFTFADIAMAQVLAFVEPPSFGLRIGRANRRAFTDEELRRRYADLIAWRDALYAAFRPRPPSPGLDRTG